MSLGPARMQLPRLRHRPPGRDDVAELMSLLPAWLGLDPATRQALPALWERLVDEPALIAGLTEDLSRPAGERAQALGVGMVLPQALVRELRLDAEPEPGIARRLYTGLLAGRWQPLGDKDIGRANARGELHLLTLHFDMRVRDLDDPMARSLMIMGAETFRAGFSGYRSQAMYFENTVASAGWMQMNGFLRRPYQPGGQQAPGGEPLAFYRLTRAEALGAAPGSTVRDIFDHHAPLFGFSATQRQLLWLSLFDAPDELLMQRLDVSVHGLKKLWRGLYERIEDAAPEFFGDAAGDNEGRRGPEKRRQVLAYVRQRPEELRPWA
ncbi:hypothetical protein [Roseateles toxinivorans]|nr:hypothetical protein [Roseateles toxinivorans]